MDENPSPQAAVVELIKRNLLIFGLIAIGIVLAGIGTVQYLTSKSAPEVEFVPSTEAETPLDETSNAEITVDVAGEVNAPGVYSLEPGSRIQDAIDAAGGLSSKADSDYIAKRLNLAQKAIDGGKIYIPSVGEVYQQPQSASNTTTDASVMGANDTSTGLIDINSASESQLDTLPRVGPVTAQKIIAGRPYGSIEELVSKKIMGQATFDGLKDQIIVQ